MQLKTRQTGVILNLRRCLHWPFTCYFYRLPHVDREVNSSLTSSVQNSLKKLCSRMQLSMVNSMPRIRLARLAAGLAHIKAMILQ